jgi:Rod binding domain-containing protein
MAEELITYKKFNDIGLANELTETLGRHNINYRVEENSALFNPAFNTDETSKEYAVKINADDFTKVNEILKSEETESVEAAGTDHYLYSFTNEELTDLVSKPDEWSEFDNLLAIKILKERGVSITEQTIKQLNNQRIEQLKQPEPSQTFGIVMGYLFALLGGVLGAFIGWYLANSKKTLPNGEQVFSYTETDRAHGKRIFYLSIVVLIALLITRILRSNE